MKPKLIRTSTVPQSLNGLLEGQLNYLNQFFEVVAVSGNDINLTIVQERENVAIRPVAMSRKISILNDLISLIKLYILFKKERPMIVHSITPKAGLLSMLAGKFAGVPIRMHTFTGLIFPSKSGLYQKLLIKMDQLLCWSATNVYPEGNGVKNDLLKFNITSKPLKVLANGNVNGIDLNHFNPSKISIQSKEELIQQLNILPNDFVFVFVGRLVKDKGVNELVEAFEGLQNKYSNVKLIIVGPYENHLDPLLETTVESIKENKSIIDVGFQKDVRPYLTISHALAFPSYREGFPNVVMQAGSMGLPCIVTDINGCNEIIKEGKNGIIIPVNDTNALHNAMQQLLTDTKLYNHLQQNARPMICNRYEQKVVWEALLEEYHLLLKADKNQ